MPTFTIKPWSQDPTEQAEQIQKRIKEHSDSFKATYEFMNTPAENILAISEDDIKIGDIIEIILSQDSVTARLKKP